MKTCTKANLSAQIAQELKQDSSSFLKMLFNRKETAGCLSICVRSLDKLVASGDLPAVRIGRRRLFTVKDIEAFIAARRDGGAV